MGIYVAFQDASEERVTSIFDCPQDPEVWPNQGIVESDDPRYLNFPAIRLLAGGDFSELARVWRDAEIVRVTWLRDRHRDEVDMGADTTLTAGQYAELMAYIKALRDWPATPDFPAEQSKPVEPEWVVSQVQ
jgi:hypothetical protein